MRIIFSIEFRFRNKTYLGIVRIVELPGHVEYHVRVMNARVDKWLFGHHIFRESPGQLPAERTIRDERVEELRNAVLEALRTRLQSQAAAIASGSRQQL